MSFSNKMSILNDFCAEGKQDSLKDLSNKLGVKENYLFGNNIYANNYGLYVVNSQDDIINSNNFENNGIGLFFKDIEDTELFFNNFIQNTQHCQFTEPKNTVFSSNYWDNWLGNLFKRDISIPKIINGVHDPEQTFLSQIKIDRNPIKEPNFI